jgi:uncharacterized protein YbjT (DUF2867 family)
MRVLVTGASGYVGGRLVPLLQGRGYDVRCYTRGPGRLRGHFDQGVEIVEGDVTDPDATEAALRGCDAAYYLVHSMGSTKSFVQTDRKAAHVFGEAAKRAGVKLIIYLGGMGEDTRELSTHLRSRHEVGDILRKSGVPIIEFRAAQIIGGGSISFEMVRYLTERLPIMIAPRWVVTRCQPIGISDVLSYLIAALALPHESRMYEIGGTDVITYREMMLCYAKLRGLKRRIITVPFFTPQLSSYWVHLVTPIPAKLAQPLIRGLGNEVIVRDDAALRDFPEIHPMGLEEAMQAALDRNSGATETTWFDTFDVRTLPGDFNGGKEGMLIDHRVRDAEVPADRVAAVFMSLGGKRGWLVGNILWRVRGWMDSWVGGVGLRRGRRSATDLRLGDAVDFWRVDAYEPHHLLRLRAEMKLPGRAWLQFEAEPTGAASTTFRQTAFFEPRGLFGILYWYSLKLIHSWLFAQLAKRIVREAMTEKIPL